MKNVRTRPKIALLGMSVMGGGTRGNGIPVLVDLFERLSAQYEITFYSFQRVDLRNVPAAVGVIQVTSWRIPGRIKYLLMTLRVIVDHLKNPYDIFFSVSIYPPGRAAILLGKIFRKPVLIQMIALEAVNLHEINCGNLTVPWLARITRDVCEKADHLIAVSDYQAEVARNDLPTAREIAVLPLRIVPQKFIHVVRSIKFPVQFIHIAYYSPIKDQDTMFKAFARVSQAVDCHLTVIGSGYDSPDLLAGLETLGIAGAVTFKGFVLQDEIPAHFGNKHILLHTARFETGCAVIQEAMASGVAVAGTRVGLLSDIGDDFAIIVPPGNDDELAEKILDLIRDPLRYSALTANAFKWINTYDAAWSAKKYADFIDSKLRA